MSYSRKETKILTDYYRHYWRNNDDPEHALPCIQCNGSGQGDGENCTMCNGTGWTPDNSTADPLDDLPDNLDQYCDHCGHAPGRCKCNRHLEILEQRIELYESWQRPASIPIKFAKMQATFFWEGYCDGAGLDWDIREAGRRRVQEIDD